MIWRDTMFLLGVPVDRVSMGEALGRIFAMLHAYREDHRPRLATTVSVDMLARALSPWRSEPKHPEFLGLLRNADLVTSDAIALVWLSRLLGIPLPARVTGRDLVPSVTREAARRGNRLFILCGRRDVAEKAAAAVRNWFPGLNLAGCAEFPTIPDVPGDAPSAEEQELVARINASGAEILLVSLANPRLRLQFYRMHPRLQVPVTVGVGDALGALAAGHSRAPLWMQCSHLEWLYDLAKDPRRFWKPYVRDAARLFVLALPLLTVFWLLGLWHRRRRLLTMGMTGGGSASVPVKWLRSAARQVTLVELPSVFGLAAVEHLGMRVIERAFTGDAVLVDLRDVRYMDAAGIGFLSSMLWECNRRGLPFLGIGVHPGARQVLKTDRAWDFLGPCLVPDFRDASRRLAQRWGGASFCFAGAERCDEFGRVRLAGFVREADLSLLEEVANDPAIRGRDVILDGSGCVDADAGGIRACIGAARRLQASGRLTVFAGFPLPVQEALRREAPAELLLFLAPDVVQAQRRLQPQKRPAITASGFIHPSQHL